MTKILIKVFLLVNIVIFNSLASLRYDDSCHKKSLAHQSTSSIHKNSNIEKLIPSKSNRFSEVDCSSCFNCSASYKTKLICKCGVPLSKVISSEFPSKMFQERFFIRGEVISPQVADLVIASSYPTYSYSSKFLKKIRLHLFHGQMLN